MEMLFCSACGCPTRITSIAYYSEGCECVDDPQSKREDETTDSATNGGGNIVCDDWATW